MQQLPHRYFAAAITGGDENVTLQSDRLPTLHTSPPPQYGGRDDRWSPETLLVGAIADCFALTFRGIARASRLPWTHLRCDVEGTLDRVDGVTQFTEFQVRASLKVPPGTDEGLAQRVLERSEHTCLIVNSLKGVSRLETAIDAGPRPSAAERLAPR